MIPIKIQCGCGQKYAFDVEPVNGRMASAVACPVCGADGTAAADMAIVQALAAQSVSVPTPGTRLRTATPTATPPHIYERSPSATPRGSTGRTTSSRKVWKTICRVILGIWIILVVIQLIKTGIIAIGAVELVNRRPETMGYVVGYLSGQFIVGLLFLALFVWGFRKLGDKN
jgi:uncharacterized membrane protein (Fun14 family)